MDFLEPLQTVWDYWGMHQTPEPADVIVGFGNFNTNIARRAAELYAKKGYQIPQYIPPEAWKAFHKLVAMGFDKQLAK